MSSAEKFMPSYKARTRPIETQLNRNTLVDIVAVYLQAMSVVKDCENITDIEFGTSSNDIVPIKIHFKKGSKK